MIGRSGNKLCLTMMLAPNSRARKEGKKTGEVKGEYEEFEGRKRRAMLAAGE